MIKKQEFFICECDNCGSAFKEDDSMIVQLDEDDMKLAVQNDSDEGNEFREIGKLACCGHEGTAPG